MRANKKAGSFEEDAQKRSVKDDLVFGGKGDLFQAESPARKGLESGGSRTRTKAIAGAGGAGCRRE